MIDKKVRIWMLDDQPATIQTVRLRLQQENRTAGYLFESETDPGIMKERLLSGFPCPDLLILDICLTPEDVDLVAKEPKGFIVLSLWTS